MQSNQISLFVLVGIILYLALIISAIYHNSKTNKPMPQKLLWYAIIIFAPFIGSIMYWILGRK
ncbi:PLDc N-terminal domain-containing protein [Pedobacter sp. UYP30]|uniref:PLDc N-terminal domain-containing protein n=1 Tax=Pedobacter sp. UYP30 TaxID=1756400 RepID=UPI00339A86FA